MPLNLTLGVSGGCGNVHVGACDGSVRGYLRGSQTENGYGPGMYVFIYPGVWRLFSALSWKKGGRLWLPFLRL